ncbi:cation diffusion facilitator family transporter [Bailinhaonella thermotolerans]|uniref:Cation diffusion facilitator family transporter n=1 Tax=Bailinhaonella thermotolerans TaxID=1070861 RepID=A0A3A4B494_9ACTN|nr:cation diffusion facilitator family transporter [Bailinhaonella thermotolerans]RJL35390.1 cation diffusion facilitator family transporter [Bailinhaonella thermotolerans]
MGGTGTAPAGGSVVTVLVAGGANLAIACAKAVAGAISGSGAMLSEAAHSVADTLTEVLLLMALRRGSRKGDRRHPFGYGREGYFWAFLAALATFVLGAGFSITHGVHTVRDGEELGSFGVSYLVIAASLVLEGISWVRAYRQASSAAKRWRANLFRFVRLSADTPLKAVLFEDTAALIGLLLAAGGLGLSQLTGNPMWDGLASILIGVLLLVVAITLGRDNISFLIGRSLPREMEHAIAEELESIPEIRSVVLLYTSVLSPTAAMVAAKVDFADCFTAAQIEAAASEAERRLREAIPLIRYVFLDPTSAARTR